MWDKTKAYQTGLLDFINHRESLVVLFHIMGRDDLVPAYLDGVIAGSQLVSELA